MSRKKTPEEYIKECKDKGLDLPIEDYIKASIKIKHKCKQGHIYTQRPNRHLYGQGCPICGGTKRKTSKEYYDLCKEKGLDLPIEDYVNAKIAIKHKCKQRHIYKQIPCAHIGQRQGCPICNGGVKLTSNQYYSLCKEKGYDLPIEDYVNSTTKIKHKCNNGHIYVQQPNSHLQGRGCPICNESHGEKFIRNYLNNNNIKYIPQKKFHDLKDKTYLSYDFYLPDYNTLIEYQGQQHFQSVSFNSKDYSDLDKQKCHDRIKQRFAKENGYKLLSPTYKTNTQEKINKYLDRYLVK